MKQSNPFTIEVPKYLTVNSLRKYLDDMEKSWTKQDEKFLGEFGLHPIRVEYKSGGIGDAQLIYDGGLGFIFLEKECETKKT